MVQQHHRRLSEAINERLGSDDSKDGQTGDEYPVHLGLDDAEEILRVLWEMVGHMAEDVGTQGYEYELLQRARTYAASLQAAMVISVGIHGLPVLRRPTRGKTESEQEEQSG